MHHIAAYQVRSAPVNFRSASLAGGVLERRHGPFTSFEDFYLRTRLDCTVAENLIRVGAFDSLEPDRTELLWRLPLLHDRLEALAGSSGGRRGQLRAFFSPPSRAGLERRWSLEDKVRSELELLGLTVTVIPWPSTKKNSAAWVCA